MTVIDSHLHLWDPNVLRYDWLAEVPTLNAPYLPVQLAIEDGAPDAAIVVQADCAPDQALAEVRWLNQIADTAPLHIEGIVAYAALEQGESVLAHLRQLRRMPRVVGIRRSLQNEPEALFCASDFRAGLLAAAGEGFVLDLCVRAHQFPAVLALMEWLFACAPQAKVVLDHLGKPAIARGEWDSWQRGFDALSSFPRMWCKLSGLPAEADWQTWEDAQLQPWLRHAITVFGPQRCLFGGDWPVVNLAGGYSRWRTCVEATIAGLPTEERDAIMGNNAREVYLSHAGGE